MESSMMALGVSLLEELSRKHPSSRGVKQKSTELAHALQGISSICGEVGNVGMVNLLSGSNFPPRTGMVEIAELIPETLQEDGKSQAMYSVAVAMNAVDQLAFDSGNDTKIRSHVGINPISDKKAVELMGIIDEQDAVTKTLVIHRLLGIITRGLSTFESLLANEKHTDSLTLLYFYRTIVYDEAFNIGAAWLDMQQSIITGTPILESIKRYTSVVFNIHYSVLLTVNAPDSLVDYINSFSSIGITFEEESFNIGSVNIPVKGIE